MRRAPWRSQEYGYASAGGGPIEEITPVLILVGVGLLVVALGDAAARHGSPWAELVFWAGLLLLFASCAYRLMRLDARTGERTVVVAVLCMALYLVKVLHDPSQFTFFDEFSNWRTAADIVQSHHLFHANSLESVNPLFPGSGAVTSGLAMASGLSLFKAGLIVVGVGRLLLGLTIYKLIEQLTNSGWLSGIAALIYISNPNFLFFDSQFAYESLALPLALFTLWAATKRASAGGDLRFTIATVGGIGAVTLSHHLTSYALIATFLGWTLVALVRHLDWRWPAFLTFLTVLAVGFWTLLVAGSVIPYVMTPLEGAVTGLFKVLTFHAPPKRLNASGAGQSESLWAQLTSYLTVLLLLGGLLVGFRRALRWFPSPLGSVLVLAALGYPLSLALRLAQEGTETSNRASEFLFLGLGLVCAVTLALVNTKFRQFARPFSLVSLSIAFVGGVLIGLSPTTRLPGGYLPGTDVRSVNPESVAAAEWAANHLDRRAPLVTDRENRQLMGAYGFQTTIVSVPHAPDLSELFYSQRFNAKCLTILRRGNIRYVVIDLRISRPPAAPGVYFTSSEPSANGHKAPVPARGLRKFDTVPVLDRIFSSGNIRIYEVNRLIGCLPHCFRGAPRGGTAALVGPPQGRAL